VLFASAGTTVAWIILGPLTALIVTIVAGRLLGTRRGWLALVVSGVVGWTIGVVAAGIITHWRWDTAKMIFLALVLGTLFTMIVAVGLDLLTPPGSIVSGESAGLITLSNPIGRMRQRVRLLRRYRSILGIARANGLGRSALHRDEPPEGLRQTLEQAGGMLVKVGQVASTRPDILPPVWCDELSKLRSQAQPASREDMQVVLEAELGGPVEDSFSTFEWRPLASASIGQVYRASLRDGTPVVVKVQRPALDDTIEIDSAAIMQIAGLVERRTAIGLAIRPVTLAQGFIQNVKEELDFTKEMSNAIALREALEPVPDFAVPTVFTELCTKRLLVEEQVSGTTISDRDRIRELGMEPTEVAKRLLNAFLVQIMEVGVFHADPHPGNILLQDDGTIVLIDLGAVGRIGRSQRQVVVQLIGAAGSGEAAGVREAIEQITVVDERANRRLLELALEDLFDRHLRAGGGITTAALQELTVVVGQFGIRLPPWFGILSRTLVTLEGTLRTISPRFSLIDSGREYAASRLREQQAGPASLQELMEQEAIAEFPRLQRMPQRLDDLLGQALSGQLSARVSLFSRAADEQVVRTLVNRLALAVIAASIGLGSVLLLGERVGPTLSGTVTLNEILGYIGLASAAILVMRIITKTIRDG
jgi:ubiquinone biosynthesis protein